MANYPFPSTQSWNSNYLKKIILSKSVGKLRETLKLKLVFMVWLTIAATKEPGMIQMTRWQHQLGYLLRHRGRLASPEYLYAPLSFPFRLLHSPSYPPTTLVYLSCTVRTQATNNFSVAGATAYNLHTISTSVYTQVHQRHFIITTDDPPYLVHEETGTKTPTM